ncbi:hypothetical protein [Burkholderia phage vB_BglM_WTB]
MNLKKVAGSPAIPPKMHALSGGEVFERGSELYMRILPTLDDAHDSEIKAIRLRDGQVVKFPINYDYTPVEATLEYSYK